MLLVGGVVVVGGYMYFGGSADVVENNLNQIVNETNQNSAGKKMAFTEFLKQGGAYKCSVSQNIEGTESAGTVYVNQGLVRGSFATQMEGQKITSDMLVRDGFSYVWSSASPTGFKVSVAVSEGEGDTTTGTMGAYSWNADQIGNYNCEPWAADPSVFTVPSNIQFMNPGDMGAMFNR